LETIAAIAVVGCVYGIGGRDVAGKILGVENVPAWYQQLVR
jgi:hypothetical protein